jgi:hypothetical protein
MTPSRDPARLRQGLNPLTTTSLGSFNAASNTPLSAMSMSVASPHLHSAPTLGSAIQPYNPQQWVSSPATAPDRMSLHLSDAHASVLPPTPPSPHLQARMDEDNPVKGGSGYRHSVGGGRPNRHPSRPVPTMLHHYPVMRPLRGHRTPKTWIVRHSRPFQHLSSLHQQPAEQHRPVPSAHRPRLVRGRRLSQDGSRAYRCPLHLRDLPLPALARKAFKGRLGKACLLPHPPPGGHRPPALPHLGLCPRRLRTGSIMTVSRNRSLGDAHRA